MKAATWRRFAARRLQPETPGYVLTRSILHHPDTALLLRGITKDSSSFSTQFCVQVFAQPLWVPSDYLVLDYGGRLGTLHGGSEQWWPDPLDSGQEVDVARLVRTEAVPFLEGMGDLDALRRHVLQMPNWRIAPTHLEVLIGISILANRQAELDKLAGLSAAVRPTAPWVAESRERIVHLADLGRADPALAVSLLHDRAQQTGQTLSLK